ncbi:GAF domain-containing sensor histidine kinase [Frankia sp. Cr1]|uniref:GAF domain-containing sensor histidine kinase n=1 Tax=Frankia sp. Cr1 TaxID=3073931 RepID=UPI002AD4C49B|nr:GAF domain-containing protein [Frankia sp. Cr1]
MDAEAGGLDEPGSTAGNPVATDPTGGGDELMFPTVARLDLDELLSQLIERAQDVMGTQDRLRGLLRASRVIAADIHLPDLLRRIVEAARALLDAEYAALGVVAPDLRLEQFIHVGMTAEDADHIGHLPTGKGVLGLLVREPRPQRLDDISKHPQAHGFPPGHPPMKTFVGVPIRIRSEIFGNLYVAGKRDGRQFTAEDEELALALAATAGIAIENARLFAESQQRQHWLTASAELTRHLLADGDDPLKMIGSKVQAVAEADFTAVLLEGDTADHLKVDVALGPHSEGLVGTDIALDRSIVGRALRERRPLRVDDATADTLVGLEIPRLGPLMAVPLAAASSHGALLIGRSTGGHAFTESELDMATGFAGHVAIAIELARARAERDQLGVLKDRDRIARDLHDHVIQRLFAVALGMQDMAEYEESADADRLAGYINDLDATIKEIRATIFELRHTRTPDTRVRARLVEVVKEFHPVFGFRPRVHTEGPVDTLIDGAVAENLLAAVREGLSDAARHALPTSIDITVRIVAETVTLDIVDDGGTPLRWTATLRP